MMFVNLLIVFWGSEESIMQANHYAYRSGFQPRAEIDQRPLTTKQYQQVHDYYVATAFDYSALWTGKTDQAIHFGYWDADVKTHTASLLRMNEVLAQTARVQASDHVLDAGCGYGGSSVWLARTIGCQVTGIAIVPFQIDKAQRHARA